MQDKDSPVGLLLASHLLHLEQQIVNLGAFPARTQTAGVNDIPDAGAPTENHDQSVGASSSAAFLTVCTRFGPLVDILSRFSSEDFTEYDCLMLRCG